jgi:Domain of Unknown Function (DUF748)
MDAPATTAPATIAADTPATPRRRRRLLKTLLILSAVLVVLGVVGRLIMPTAVEWYVNRTLQQSILYRGTIGDIDIHLYRGAYSIRDVQISKVTGNMPVPLFEAERVDLAIEWASLWHGNVVGVVQVEKPQINFVDGADDGGGDGGDGSGQTGAGGPWLAIIRDLFPFKINSVVVHDGSVHFRTYRDDVPVNVYLSQFNMRLDNLTNIREEAKPLITTVHATALAMDQAEFETRLQIDPFSYNPTFHMTARLMNLDVRKLNDLTRTYGKFDFERGWLDLVIEVDAKEGALDGYVKPLFRNLHVVDLERDIREDDPFEFFVELLVGGVENVLKNQPRDQFATVIPFSGNTAAPQTDFLATIGNVLRNAFVRAYLPRFQGADQSPAGGLTFAPARIISPADFSADSSTDSKDQTIAPEPADAGPAQSNVDPQ